MYGQPVSLPRRRARVGYVFAVLIFVVAVVAFILAGVGFSAVSSKVDSYQRVSVPGDTTMTFSSGGQYELFLEGTGYSGLRRVHVRVQSKTSGRQVAVKPLPSGTSSTYTVNGHSGVEAATIDIPAAGQYDVFTSEPTDPAPADVAVGQSLIGDLAEFGAGLAIGIIGVVISVLIGIITGVVRRGRSRRLQFAGGPPVAGPAYPQYPGAQYPGAQYPGAQYPGAPGPQQYPGPGPYGP